MTEVEAQDPYRQQLTEVTDDSLKTGLESLFDAGYIDFDENKIMIENNPEMCLDDIMACIDESKKDEENKLVDFEEAESEDAAAGDYDDKDIEEMNKLVGTVVDSNTETDPENEADFVEKEKLEIKEDVGSTGPSSKQVNSDGDSKDAVQPFEENKNPNLPEPHHEDPNLYIVRKKPKRAIPGTKTEKATEIQQRVG